MVLGRERLTFRRNMGAKKNEKVELTLQASHFAPSPSLLRSLEYVTAVCSMFDV